jgi:hypothetical protein
MSALKRQTWTAGNRVPIARDLVGLLMSFMPVQIGFFSAWPKKTFISLQTFRDF